MVLKDKQMKKNYALLFLSFAIQFSFATTRNVPGTYSTVQAALTACNNGDTILVQPGTYTGNIVWPNKSNLKLYSAGDSSNTILSGNNTGQVLRFSLLSAVDTNTIIKGFKITNGFVNTSSSSGGGIYIASCHPKFVDVSITNNHLYTLNWAYGAGVYLSGSNSVFRNSTIWANKLDTAAWGHGAGIYITGSSAPKFYNVKINGNRSNSNSWAYGTGVYCDGSNAVFSNVKVCNNYVNAGAIWYYGTGMYFNASTSSLTNVLVSSNTQDNNGSFYYGAGIYSNGSSGAITMTNCTVTDNKRTNGGTINGSGLYANTSSNITALNSIFYNTNGGLEVVNNGGTVVITYSDVRGGFIGTGNINLSPAFVSSTDFHLTNLSPCVAAGLLSGSPGNDLDYNARPMPALTNPDMGCYELNQPPVSVSNMDDQLFSLQVYPNPFNTTTEIHFSLSQTALVNVEIVEINGKLIEKLLDGEFPKSEFVLKFDGTNLAQGMYFCRMTIGNEVHVVKMMKQ